MKTSKMMLLTGAAIFTLANPGSHLNAQQSWPYYYDPPRSSPTPNYNYYLPPPSGKLYLGFDIGAALQPDITIKDTFGESDKVTFDPGIRLDFQPGYNFTTNWATEAEVGLIINPVAHSYVLGTDFMNVDLVELPVTVNVIYTRLPGHHFSAYVGGGVGSVFSDYENEFGDTTPSESALAFQGMAGIKYTPNERWDIGVAYKFLGTTSHDIGSGVTFDGSRRSNTNPTEP